jgi:glycosyltransferase involved in cell wall biosynthesis
MLIVHNFRAFPEKWQTATGRQGTSIYAGATAAAFLEHRRNPEAVFVVNGNVALVMELAARMFGGARRPLVAVDLVLREPEDIAGRLELPLKKALLSRVDRFIHYFRDLRGLTRVYGIGPEHSSYVPFKVNLADRHALVPEPEGEYVLCFGRSMRDFDTFLEAMERLPDVPGAITRPDPRVFAAHHARFTRPISAIPANVCILEDDRTEESEIRILRNAKLVVLPILARSLVASGISTCLNAMYLGKCVIGSEGPGMSDIFTSEVLTFPPEDSQRMAEAIRRAWDDSALRRATAAAGRQFALQAGAEPELYQRIIDEVTGWDEVALRFPAG